MRACFLVLFLALLSGCQTQPLLESILMQDSTLTFEKLDGPRGDVVLSITANAEGIL